VIDFRGSQIYIKGPCAPWTPPSGKKVLYPKRVCDDNPADDVMKSTIMNFKNPISKISKEIYIQSEMYK